jgi:hypothetical protein
MSDVVVTVPKSFGLDQWIAEGDPAGSQWSGQLWGFSVPRRPKIEPGERVYVVHDGKLRGYALLVAVDFGYHGDGVWEYSLVRGGGAVAVTIPEPIPGFRGFRYRWWPRELERPFPDWRENSLDFPGKKNLAKPLDTRE